MFNNCRKEKYNDCYNDRYYNCFGDGRRDRYRNEDKCCDYRKEKFCVCFRPCKMEFIKFLPSSFCCCVRPPYNRNAFVGEHYVYNTFCPSEYCGLTDIVSVENET